MCVPLDPLDPLDPLGAAMSSGFIMSAIPLKKRVLMQARRLGWRGRGICACSEQQLEDHRDVPDQ